ncbi:type I-G CRISPR-associated protein Csb2 [Sinosporangium siamense]|uniref:Type I-U CRISPR-associated protein Cas5/Cas6 n=1 Tax=Sinosporangium siamense TaxID=1367973 RepID=A0A919RML3_9ACTN|nr:type I-U CRISPR-associated protein Csb2 [Sinosporangium siamense]GII96338.1 hypothetical protein Ssi02_65690 [Sinosporangium siamense]
MSLTVAVRLRQGRYDAAQVDPRRVEWPPHPARVFCALVASAACAEDWEALRWLERCGSPQVWAAPSTSTARVDSYVVTNEASAKGGSASWPGRTNGARARVSAVPADERFAFVWPEAEPDPGVVARLRRMARNVPYVGRSTGQAEVSVAPEALEGPAVWSQWLPSRLGDGDVVALRVPYPGYTDALIDA